MELINGFYEVNVEFYEVNNELRFWCLGIDVPHYRIFGLTKKLKIVNRPPHLYCKKTKH